MPDAADTICLKRYDFPLSFRETLFAFISLFILLIIVYSNSFQCRFHYDDFINIVNNPNIHMREFSIESIQKVLYGKNLNRVFDVRPLSYLTFALNYFINGNDVLGYHVVNFTIHYITSIFLFLFILQTLNLPLIKSRYQKNAYAISLFSVFFWATHPVQVTAVTYIVQRMASMSAMFYIAAMFFYLRFRTETKGKRKIIWLILFPAACFFSLASKENAAMLPVSIFIYDVILIQGATHATIRKSIKPFLLVLLVIFIITLLYTSPSSILSNYKYRFFSPVERILTEPRIIIFYISLLLYPVSSRFTMLHDIEISSNFFTPWTAIPANLTVCLVIGLALCFIKKRPLICFCILFFFLNHLIESSVIPLELIYEHRNYLPSVFFFTLISIILLHILKILPGSGPVRPLVFICILFLLISQSHTTYIRNNIFLTEISLWEDNVKKAPNLSTAHINYGKSLWELGFTRKALEEYKKANNLNRFNNKAQKGVLLFNKALIDAYETKDYRKSLITIQKAFKLNNGSPNIWAELSRILMLLKDKKNALKHAETALRFWPDDPDLLYSRSVILMAQNQLGEALDAAKKLYELYPDNPKHLVVLAEIYRKRKNYRESIRLWEKIIEYRPDSLQGYLALIELGSLIREKKMCNLYIGRLIEIKKGESFEKIIELCLRDPEVKIYLPDLKIILPVIKNYYISNPFSERGQ